MKKPRREFIDSESNEEFDTCTQCRPERQRLYQRRVQELQDELERALAEDLEIDEGENLILLRSLEKGGLGGLPPEKIIKKRKFDIIA